MTKARDPYLRRRIEDYVAAGFRSSVIAVSLDVNKETIKSIRLAMCAHGHVTRIARGLARETTLLGTVPEHAAASLVAHLYRRFNGGFEQTNLDSCLRAYRQYQSLYRDSVLGLELRSPDEVWMIARNVRSGSFLLRPCRDCGQHYLWDRQKNPDCPFCILARRPVHSEGGAA